MKKAIITFIVLLAISFFMPYLAKAPFMPTPSQVIYSSSIKPSISSKPIAKKVIVQPALDQSGSPVKLYAKTYLNVYECAAITCPIIDVIQPTSYFNFPYTPKGTWIKISTLEDKIGYIQLSELIKDLPARCSAVLPYTVSYVNEQFISRGFHKEKLLEIINAARIQWEQALGKGLFRYDAPEPHNTINFTIGDYADSEPNHSGIAHILAFDNQAVAGFKISIYSKIFDGFSNYNGPDAYTLQSNAIYLTLLHEMGHSIGLGHITAVGSIMNAGGSTGQKISATPPALTGDDISLIKNFCL